MTNYKSQQTKTAATTYTTKLPPQAIDAEKALLGACLIEVKAFETVMEIVAPASFYVDAHQRIFNAMLQLHQKNTAIDVITVTAQLKTTNELEVAGGPYFIVKLTNAVTSSANCEYYAYIIQEKFLKRQLSNIGSGITAQSFDDTVDVFDLIDETDKKITALTTDNIKRSYESLHTGIVKTISRIEELRHVGHTVTGIPSGFTVLDKLTHGWQNTDLIILAARPAVGKTALALNIARYAALNKFKSVPVGFFSLEMAATQLINRMLAAESDIWLDKINTGQLSDDNMKLLYKNGVEKLNKVPVFIDDTHSLTLYDLRIKARSMKRKEKIGLLVVDYLQLMSGDKKSGNREQEISTISRGLKGLAKELEIPIIALSQLSRETEKRKGEQKMPLLSDLRESGAIEQDADMVMFMYRPEYYGETTDESGESIAGETHLKIAKNRHGQLGTIKLRADLSTQKFHNMEESIFHKLPPQPTMWRPLRNILGEKDEELI